MPKISVIMPVYNVVPYIRECIESVLNQTLQDIEVLCIDAFSTDGTREILQEYASKDSRIRLLDDDKGSCGYADNLGIINATGDYIGIVESDDYIEEDMFENLYKAAVLNDLDYIKGDYNQFISDRSGDKVMLHCQVLYHALELLYDSVVAPEHYPEIIWNDHCMWTGIYKRKFILDNNIKFNETKGAAYQDHGFIWQTVCYAKRAMYVRTAYYNYRRDNEFCSMNNPHALKMDYKELEYIEYFLKNLNRAANVHKWIFYKKVYMIFENDIKKYFRDNAELNQEVEEYAEKYISKIKEGLYNHEISDSQFNKHEWTDLNFLVDMPECYMHMIKSRAESGIKQTQSIIDRVSSAKRTVIVGSGNIAGKLYWLLVARKMKTELLFCDNNSELWGKKKWKHSVVSVEMAAKERKDALFLIANQIYGLDLWRQLVRLGISEEQIIVCSNIFEAV